MAPNQFTKPDARRVRGVRFSDNEWASLAERAQLQDLSRSEYVRKVALYVEPTEYPNARWPGMDYEAARKAVLCVEPPQAQVMEYACAYCPDRFESEAVALRHIDAAHPDQS